jgi:hypothetical protein
MYPQLPQERHLSAEQGRALEVLGTARLGGCAGATLLGHGFRIGMLAELVRDVLAMPRRDIMRDGRTGDHGSSPSAGSRKDRGHSNDRAHTIATSAITRRLPSGPGTRRCCRRCIPVWGRSNLASRGAGTFPETASKGQLERRARAP